MFPSAQQKAVLSIITDNVCSLHLSDVWVFKSASSMLSSSCHARLVPEHICWACHRQRQAEELGSTRPVVPLPPGLSAHHHHRRGSVAADCWSRSHLSADDFGAVGSPCCYTPDAAASLLLLRQRLALQAALQVSALNIWCSQVVEVEAEGGVC